MALFQNGTYNWNMPSPAPAPAATKPPAMPTPSSPTNLNKAFSDFRNIFAPPPALDPSAIAKNVQGLINQQAAPRIVAPRVPAAQVNIPGGTYQGLQSSIFESQFAPVERALARQAQNEGNALKGALAQAGLSESAAGVGQVANLQNEFGRRTEDAARDISAAATAQRYNAEIGIAQANASLKQQANLANAGFSLTAQTENAKNILAGNTAAAQAYMTALGLSADQAAQYRGQFLSFFSDKEKNRIASDGVKQQAAASLLKAYLQEKKIQADVSAQQAQTAIQQQAANTDQLKAITPFVVTTNPVVGGQSINTRSPLFNKAQAIAGAGNSIPNAFGGVRTGGY